MILSSADIVEILKSSGVIRLSASEISVVGKRPILSGREGFYIYVEQYPTLDEFEATWKVWIESDGTEPDDLLFSEMRRLLPGFEFKLGLLIEATVKDFKTDRTVTRPEAVQAPPVIPPTGWIDSLKDSFASLKEDIEDRMLLVTSGRHGRDGDKGDKGDKGLPGRDGKDLLATSAILDDLLDVNIADRIPLKKGQVLTYNGSNWENLFVPQLTSITTGGSEGSSSEEDPGGIGGTINWRYQDASGEPPYRDFHTDVSDPTAIGILHVSHQNNSNHDVSVLVRELLETSTKVYVAKVSDPSEAHLYQIDNHFETAEGFEISVTHIDTPGLGDPFDNDAVYSFQFLTPAVDSGGGGATSIDELTDVDTSTTAPFVGQTLVWDGDNWVPGDTSEGIGDAPIDGNYYVRHNGAWINILQVFAYFNIGDGGQFSPEGDGGNFTTGYGGTAYDGIFDGGDFTADTSDAIDSDDYDGGTWN
jgi:hypothetical protein